MWGKKDKKVKVRSKAGAADTLITQDTHITGDIQFKGVLYIDGHVKGDVRADELEMSLLTIGKHGVIEGQVEVPHVVVLGKVTGDVHASEHIELQSTAHIDGNVYYKLIEMAMGAEVNGQMLHREDKPKLLNHDGNTEGEAPAGEKKEPQVGDSSVVKGKAKESVVDS